MKIGVAYASHIGQIKKRQEDAILVAGLVLQADRLVPSVLDGASLNDLWLAVADGVGGGVAGERASRGLLADLDAFGKTGEGVALCVDGWMTTVFAEALRERFVGRLAGDGATRGAATTLVVAQVRGHGVRLLNVGDSPAYLLKGEAMKLLSTDHSKANGLLAQYVDPEEEDGKLFISKELTSAFVADPEATDFTVHITDVRMDPGCGLLLCSDGLTNVLRERGVRRLLDWSLSLKEQVDVWLNAVLAAGADDNVSIIWARVQE